MTLFVRQQIKSSLSMSQLTLPLLKPSLYAQRDAVRDVHRPVLLGGRCECGHTFFPMQCFGCERCGRAGDVLRAVDLQARGTLISAATVHVHADQKRPAPFVIGTIALDEGPVIRTILVGTPSDAQTPGTRVEAVLRPIATAGENDTALDLRFRVATS